MYPAHVLAHPDAVVSNGIRAWGIWHCSLMLQLDEVEEYAELQGSRGVWFTSPPNTTGKKKTDINACCTDLLPLHSAHLAQLNDSFWLPLPFQTIAVNVHL